MPCPTSPTTHHPAPLHISRKHPLTRQAIAEREAYWQQLTPQQQAVWFASRRQAYTSAPSECIQWFTEPLNIGVSRDNGEQAFVALGVLTSIVPTTVGALLVDNRGSLTGQPVLLRRLYKYAPGFELTFYTNVLEELARRYNLHLTF